MDAIRTLVLVQGPRQGASDQIARLQLHSIAFENDTTVLRDVTAMPYLEVLAQVPMMADPDDTAWNLRGASRGESGGAPVEPQVKQHRDLRTLRSLKSL